MDGWPAWLMLVDTSAIIATVAQEPDGIRFQAAMQQAASLAMSSVTVLETRSVLHARHGEAAVG
jgi:ribonuclease VapC